MEPVLPSAPPISAQSRRKESDTNISEAEAAPTAPLSESQFLNPISQVELTVSARSLLNLDQLTQSDPICVIFIQDSTTSWEWVELGRTETIFNNLNPEWKTKFLVDYRFEEKQMMGFMIYDKDCAKYSLENHDFLGKLQCSLGELVSAPHSKYTRPLKVPSIHDNPNVESQICVMAEELGDCKKFIRFQISCPELYKVKPSASAKLFVNISKQLPDGSWVLLTRTERISVGDKSALVFPPPSIRYSSVCKKGNLEIPLRLQLVTLEHGFRGKSTKVIGESVTSFIEISEKCTCTTSASFPLFKRKNSKKGWPDLMAKLEITNFKIEYQKTFMDYLQNGLEIHFAVAIDFTASNGEPSNHASLHFRHGKTDNPYVTTLKIIGEVLQDYSSSKQFHAYGFGAKGYPLANRVNHKFALNFKESNPICEGIEGILNAYFRTLQRVKLYGPTCLAPIIREVMGLAKARERDQNSTEKYFVLLILTDGVVCDPETTIEALVEASHFPVSVIIIGIGDEDFTAMEKLDSDEKLLKSRSKKQACRDIVQFVELRKFINFKSVVPISQSTKIAISKSVLAELPQQVITWMNLKNK